MDRSALKQLGEAVAVELYGELKSGKIKVIGRDVIESRCLAVAPISITKQDLETAIGDACRKAVMLATGLRG